MRVSCFRAAAALLIVALFGSTPLVADLQTGAGASVEWTDSFPLEDCDFADTGTTTYFILQPGYRLVLQGVEDSDSVTLVITVLDETQEVAGVRTRVVEERETSAGEIVEVSRNFFAYCGHLGSIFYFGEDVDMYDDGQVVGHGGAWRAGEQGFRPGLMMPGLVLSGSAYYQEIAPGVAMDRARVVNTDTTIHTPSAVFEHCLVTEETSDLEPRAHEFKYYAPGVGLIRDGAMWLVGRGW